MQTLVEIVAKDNEAQIDASRVREEYLLRLQQLLECPEIITIVGLRRCGKSTLVRQLRLDLINNRSIKAKEAIFINFEDPRLEEIDSGKSLLQLIEAFYKKIDADRILYVFLDEIDRVAGWERALNYFYESKCKIKFFITGSNSEIFIGKLATVLSGRYISIRIFPLSFKEYKKFSPIQLNEVDAVIDYLEWGGFPRVVMEKDPFTKSELLRSYFDSVVERDLVIRHKIRKPEVIRALLRYVCLNATRLFSSYNLSKVLKVNDVTINKYIDFMEQAYIVDRITVFSSSVKKQIYNPDKLILADSGLAKIAGFSGGGRSGQLLENAVGASFLKNKKRELFYWKNGTEVDYIINGGDQVELYNVTTSVDEEETYQREKKSLELASKAFPSAKGAILTLINGLKRGDSEIKDVIDYL